MLMRRWGSDYDAVRRTHSMAVARRYAFTSERKMSSVLLRLEGQGKYRLYNKGAAEWVLARCTSFCDCHGDQYAVQPMDPRLRRQFNEIVDEKAARGLRCLCIAYRDLPLHEAGRSPDFFDSPPDEGLTLMAIVGIKDPVRKEVTAAVRTCQAAGIMVRMLTGDNINTARHIARECGILKDEGLSLEGPELRAMDDAQLLQLLPSLQVLARSSPQDKYRLVALLQSQREVVAVSGDGTNDSAALKKSDVGLAMGIAGTEVAKEAADIIILDDNFASIVKSVLWGRTVFANVRKFLQFQLTINGVALVVAFVGAIVGGHEPLTVMQLLWVNLIMDTLAALALATESPNPAVLTKQPYGRTERIITRYMWKHMIVQAAYQMDWLFFFLYGWHAVLERYRPGPGGDIRQSLSLLFNTFIFCQIFNEINSRRIEDEYDIFRGLFSNVIFMGVLALTILLQVLIVQYLGSIFKVNRLHWDEWLITIAIGFGSIPLSLLTRLISRKLSKRRHHSSASADEDKEGGGGHSIIGVEGD